MRLFTKTFLYSLILMIVITVVGHLLLYYLIPKVYTDQKRDFAREITTKMADDIKRMDSADVEGKLKQFSEKNSVLTKLTYGEKSYIFGAMFLEDLTTNKNDIFKFESSITGSAGQQTGVAATDKGIENLFAFTNSQFIRESSKFKNIDGENCELETIVTLQSVNETKDIILRILPYTLLVCFFISVIFAVLFSKRITKPILMISGTTRKMKLLEPKSQCEVNSKDEIGQLSDDINTLYKELLFVIEKMKQELEQSNEIEEAKIEFLRSASHELKTPVTSARTLLDNMIMGIGKYADYDTYLPICRNMIIQLSGMIQEVLDVSKLEASTAIEEMQETNLEAFLKDVAEPYEIIAKSKGIILKMEYNQKLDIALPRKEMKKVISNLLSNAVNYTEPKKEIKLLVSNNKIIVQNECTPIAGKDLAHIFEAFYRVEHSRSRDYGGNGLGLYFVSKALKKYQYQFEFVPIKNGMWFIIYL